MPISSEAVLRGRELSLPSDDTLSTSPGVGKAVRATAALGVLGLLACVWQATVGFGSSRADSWFTANLYPWTFLPAAALFFLTARMCSRERRSWTLIGVAYLGWTAAFVVYNLSVAGDKTPAIPSVADLGRLAYYPLVFLGFLGLVRSRGAKLTGAAWLDGAIGALALAALAAAFLVDPIVSAVAGAPESVATLLAYPLGDVALALVVLTVGTQLGWRPGRDWLVIAAALVLQVVVDVAYSYQSAKGGWHFGTLWDSGWVLSSLLIAWAAWHTPSAKPQVARDRWHALAVPSAFTIMALAILVIASFERVGTVPSMLAAAVVVASLWRAVTTFQEKRLLGTLALRDPLTGLLNHGAFHAELEAEVARRQDSTDPFSVVVLDLDGFKEVNDLRGHAEGDRVLREVAAAIADVPRGADVSGRVGGDEFAMLLRGADGPAAKAVAQRVRDAVRRRGIGIDASFGVGTWPEDGPSKGLLMLRADTALYAAKSAVRAVRDGDEDGAGARMRRDSSEVERSKRDLERAQLRAYAKDVRDSYVRELQRSQELKQSYLATVRTLAATVEAKDEYTGGHIQRVHVLGLLLAQSVVPQEAGDAQLSYGLLLHDVGKLSVPDAVLNKPGKLDEREWELMKQHPEQGAKILSAIPFLGRALDVVRHHHERWDGGGYPEGLRGEEIPLWARTFAIVDTVDAITSDRPYRQGRPLEVAVDELRKGAGTQFDPACVEAFASIDPDRIEVLLEHRGEPLRALGDMAVPAFSLKAPVA